jgi:hypothetical protein
MKNLLPKILSINPILSLVLVISYIAFCWFIAATLWNKDHEIGAVIFAVTLYLATRSQSKGLIDKLKSIKAQKRNNT